MNKEQVADDVFYAWHTISSDEALSRLASVRGGLSNDEVGKRLARYGPNQLPVRKPPTVWQIFLHQFKSPLIYILLAAGVVALVLKEFTDAGFIGAVLFLNATLGTIQEYNAEKSAAALQGLLKTFARVRRGGRELSVPAAEVVPGDVALLESGDKVPADLRLFEVNNLSVDESFLTGENIPPVKNLAVLNENVSIGDRLNMAFAGSMVMSGRATGVVVATASATQVGQIASSVAFTESSKPPLIVRMEKFAHQISVFVGIAVGLLAVIGLLKGMAAIDVFFLAVALAVSAIPEGLPVAMTVALSIAVRRMAKRNVIVRKLPAVEGLGSCTCIASDKTGTLTVNRQTVKALSLPGLGHVDVGGEGFEPTGELTVSDGDIGPDQHKRIQAVAIAGAMCNEGMLEQDQDGNWVPHGDAMDVALLTFARKAGIDVDGLRAGADRIAEIPYESERKYAGSFYRVEGRAQVAVKGALEKVLGFCDRLAVPGGTVPIDTEAVERDALALAEKGYRVLAIAHADFDENAVALVPGEDAGEEHIPKLTLLGLAGFMDPLRPEVMDAVDKCRKAGISVVMVTGDHPATAYAIASQLGIADSPAQIVTGAELAVLHKDSDEHRREVAGARVFARVSPLQKLEIVDSLIAAGHFVAVTGDGVNDAPALKKANVGVAMGSGTEVAKDTASIVVTDDNFASIQAGVEEGRFAYDNVRKVTYLLISCGLAEVLMFTVSLLAGLPMPLTAVQLLWLNLVTNGIQDVALAFEGGEPGAMKRPPRKPTEGMFNGLMTSQVVTSGVTMATICTAAWFWLLNTGMPEAEARSLLLLLMVLCQNTHVFNVRSERVSAFRVPISRNYLLFFGVLVAQGLHLGAMNFGPMQDVLGVVPTTFTQWLTMFGLALGMIAAMEIFKAVRR